MLIFYAPGTTAYITASRGAEYLRQIPTFYRLRGHQASNAVIGYRNPEGFAIDTTARDAATVHARALGEGGFTPAQVAEAVRSALERFVPSTVSQADTDGATQVVYEMLLSFDVFDFFGDGNTLPELFGIGSGSFCVGREQLTGFAKRVVKSGGVYLDGAPRPLVLPAPYYTAKVRLIEGDLHSIRQATTAEGTDALGTYQLDSTTSGTGIIVGDAPGAPQVRSAFESIRTAPPYTWSVAFLGGGVGTWANAADYRDGGTRSPSTDSRNFDFPADARPFPYETAPDVVALEETVRYPLQIVSNLEYLDGGSLTAGWYYTWDMVLRAAVV